jgi:protein-disulfide isomerase
MFDKRKLVMAVVFFMLFVVVAFFAVFIIAQKNEMVKKSINNLNQSKNQEAEDLLQLNQEALASAPGEAQVPTIASTDHFQGDLNAPVKIIVFEDVTDLYSSNFNDVLKTVAQNYGDKVVIAFKPFMLAPNTLVRDSFAALECAGEQSKFNEFRDEILGKAKSGELTSEKLGEYANSLGLDQTKFDNCLLKGGFQDKVAKIASEAQQYSVYGAPTIFINNQIVPGARSLEDATDSAGERIEGLKTIIDRQLNND